jgi:hypothetical protein
MSERLLPPAVAAKIRRGFTTIKPPTEAPPYREGNEPAPDHDKPITDRRDGGFKVIRTYEIVTPIRAEATKPTDAMTVFSPTAAEPLEYQRLGSSPDEIRTLDERIDVGGYHKRV